MFFVRLQREDYIEKCFDLLILLKKIVDFLKIWRPDAPPMIKTTAIIHAAGANRSELEILIKKLKRFTERINFYPNEIRVNASPVKDIIITENNDLPSTLIFGWGLAEKPCWTKWSYEIKTSKVIKLFIAIDLYEKNGVNGRVLMVPNLKAGNYWRNKSWQTRCKLFLEGCYVSTFSPYGMKRIPKDIYNDDLMAFNPHILVPGSLQEIEIVRLIFDLFVSHNYTVTEISNLLNAQRIKAPNKSKIWNSKKVKSLMSSPVYIGSNQYGACVKHNAFPALIERSTFCAAQARIYGKEEFISTIT